MISEYETMQLAVLIEVIQAYPFQRSATVLQTLPGIGIISSPMSLHSDFAKQH